MYQAKCGGDDVDSSVLTALEDLKESLVEVGPNLARGILNLSFYVIRENKTLFGYLCIMLNRKILK